MGSSRREDQLEESIEGDAAVLGNPFRVVDEKGRKNNRLKKGWKSMQNILRTTVLVNYFSKSPWSDLDVVCSWGNTQRNRKSDRCHEAKEGRRQTEYTRKKSELVETRLQKCCQFSWHLKSEEVPAEWKRSTVLMPKRGPWRHSQLPSHTPAITYLQSLHEGYL